MTKAAEFTSLPAWAMPTQRVTTSLWEVIALAKLEGQFIRLSAADQTALLGKNVFGKQAFRVNEDGTVTVTRKTAFGMDSESCDYEPSKVNEAAIKGLKLSPGTFGPGYL